MYVYERSLSALRMSRAVIARIEKRDRDLARQYRRAASSVSLNISEGQFAKGGNGRLRLETAMNSAREVRACLDVADAMGYLEAESFRELDALLDGIVATLWVMCRR